MFADHPGTHYTRSLSRKAEQEYHWSIRKPIAQYSTAFKFNCLELRQLGINESPIRIRQHQTRPVELRSLGIRDNAIKYIFS